MVTEIIKGIYQLEIPLPGNPLRTLNSYLIKGDKRSLLVDTGFNWLECKRAQLSGLATLGIKWSEVDFFITHVHGDHSGLVYELADQNARVYCSKTDADIMRSCMEAVYWQTVNRFCIQHGYPREKIRNQWDTIKNFISGTELQFVYVEDGEVINIGEFDLTCIATPGHSPGHMCLYEPKHKILFSGDHILASITSNITAWTNGEDYLGKYLASLDKVEAMDIKLVLPGHRQVIHDSHRRIGELKKHHETRLGEILEILQQGAMSAYQVAGQMHWDLGNVSWEEVSSYQQWFATGEAVAHLEHLIERGKVVKKLENNYFNYTLL